MTLARPPSGLLEAVIFDLDGTLLDTRPGIRAAITAAFAEHAVGTVVAEEANLSLPLDEMIGRLGPMLSEVQRREVSASFRRHYDLDHWRSAELYPGAHECLRALRAGGIRAFVATNKRATPTRWLLEHFGLAGLLEAVLAQSDSAEPTQKAVLIGQCLQRGGLDPTVTVVVGDSDQDALAASAWGIVFAAVTTGAGPLGHAAPSENRVELSSLADVTDYVLSRARGEKL